MHIILNLVALSKLQSFLKSYLAFLKNWEKKYCNFSTILSKPTCRQIYHKVIKNTILKVKTHIFETQFAYVHMKNATSSVATAFSEKKYINAFGVKHSWLKLLICQLIVWLKCGLNIAIVNIYRNAIKETIFEASNYLSIDSSQALHLLYASIVPRTCTNMQCINPQLEKLNIIGRWVETMVLFFRHIQKALPQLTVSIIKL